MAEKNLSPHQYKALIPLGLGDGQSIIAMNVDALWRLHLRYQSDPYLQYLHARKSAIMMLMGNLDETVPFPISKDLIDRLRVRRDILIALLSEVTSDIAKGGTQKSRAPVVINRPMADIIPSPPNQVDANSIRYQGDPNDRGRRR